MKYRSETCSEFNERLANKRVNLTYLSGASIWRQVRPGEATLSLQFIHAPGAGKRPAASIIGSHNPPNKSLQPTR